MIDIVNTRTLAMRVHPAIIIFAMLMGLSLVGAVLVGYGMAPTRNWVQMVGYALAWR